MPEKENGEIEEIKHETEEIKEIVEEIIEIEKTNTPKESKAVRNKTNALAWIITAVIVLITIFGAVAYKKPSVFSFLQPRNQYGFDFNYNKVRSADWDTILTKKKIASAIDVPNKNINMLKNPDQNQVMEDPKAFSAEPNCITILDEKFLNETEIDKNLLTANISLCKTTAEAAKLYTDRHDGTKNAGQEDKSINVKKFEDLKIGEKSYNYSVEKTATAEGETNSNYAGLALLRGPFVVMFEEQEQAGVTKMSADELKIKLAKYIDTQLKKSLAMF